MTFPTSLRRLGLTTLLLLALLSTSAFAHEHEMEDVGPYEQNFMNEEVHFSLLPLVHGVPDMTPVPQEIDGTLKWHIGIQIACWGLLFPAGMVLGITKSRFHVPWQVRSSCGVQYNEGAS